MTAAFVRQQGSTSVANAGNKIQVTYNTGVTAPVNGNVALMVGGGNKGSTISYNDPAGSRYVSAVAQISDGATSGSANGFAETRVLATADAGVLDQWVLTSSTANLLGAILEYSGVSTTTPLDVTPVTDNTDLTSLPGITTVTDGCVIVYWALLRSAVTVTAPPAGFTQRVNTPTTSGTNDVTLFIADKVQTTHGATGAVGPGLSGTPSHLVSGLIALRPAGSVASLDLTGAPGSAGAVGTPGSVQTSAPTAINATGESGASGTSGLLAAIEFELLSGPGVAGTSGIPGIVTSASANVAITGAPGSAGTAAIVGSATFDSLGHLRLAGARGSSGASSAQAIKSLNVFIRTGGAAGTSGRVGTIRTSLPVDISISVDLTDRDQWSFGRADS